MTDALGNTTSGKEKRRKQGKKRQPYGNWEPEKGDILLFQISRTSPGQAPISQREQHDKRCRARKIGRLPVVSRNVP